METLLLAVAPLVVVLVGFWVMLRGLPTLILLLLGLLLLWGLGAITQPDQQIAILLLLGLIFLLLLRRR
jgi:Na+/H+ antiporter NhaD/arsenite permease-like protein